MNTYELKEKVKKSEGIKDFMYGDHLGNVTIGIGVLLSTEDSAVKIINDLYEPPDMKKPVAEAEVRKQWKDVYKLAQEDFKKSKGNPKKARSADSYKTATQIRMKPETIEQVFSKKFETYQNEIIGKHFDKLLDRNEIPDEAAYAIMDIYYNVGGTNFLQFEKFKKAIKAKNWFTAAIEAYRPSQPEDRNKEVQGALFELGKKKQELDEAGLDEFQKKLRSEGGCVLRRHYLYVVYRRLKLC